MANWQTLALIHVLVGYEADLLGMISFSSGGGRTVNGLLICGFFFYTIVALIVSLQQWADLKAPEKIMNIILVILLIIAGLLIVAGVGVADSDHHADVYHSMLEVVGALFALISAVFLIILLACGGGSKTSPA